MNTFILASASPRRTELLNQAGIEHIIIPSECEERTVKTAPGDVVEDLSHQKAEDVFAKYSKTHPCEHFIILGSDTIVFCDDRILGKPKDEAEARQMLSRLQNNTHQVYTGVTLIENQNGHKNAVAFHECSEVYVSPMTAAEITAYIRTGEPLDKAGGYGIQGTFARYVRRIEGDYSNIVGLPIARLYQELKDNFGDLNLRS